MDDRIITSFVSRGIYASKKDVITAALKALVKEQMQKEAADRGSDQTYSDETYSNQIGAKDSHAEKELKKNAPMGHLGRRTGTR